MQEGVYRINQKAWYAINLDSEINFDALENLYVS